MGRLARFAFVLTALATACPAAADDESPWIKARDGLTNIWQEGTNDFYLPFHTHHLRSAYDREKIDSYQENPLGFGFGRSLYEEGLWRGVYLMAFQDSHYKPSYMLGYGHQWLWQPTKDWRVGGGLTAFFMARADIGHYTPFPGILPTASIGYKAFSIETTYVPGGRGAGNILFFWGRIELDRK
jgi:hypothetical protein